MGDDDGDDKVDEYDYDDEYDDDDLNPTRYIMFTPCVWLYTPCVCEWRDLATVMPLCGVCVMLCCVVLCCVVLCYVMLCCVMLCCVVFAWLLALP